MKRTFALRRPTALLALVSVALLGACGEDPTGLDEHPEPEGVLVRVGGQTVASYDGSRWSAELTVAAGQQLAVEVVFVDGAGRALPRDDEEYLDVVMGNVAVATFVHSSPGSYSGTLRGVVAGQTTAVFRLMHGAVGSGHPDFVTAPATVRVN